MREDVKPNGWIRLWIVLSGMWMAIAGWLTYGELSTTYSTTEHVVAKDGVGEVTFVFSKAQLDYQRTLEEHWIPTIEAEPSKFVGKQIAEPYDAFVRAHGRRKIREGTALILLPPLLLLLLGWSIAWVRRGF